MTDLDHSLLRRLQGRDERAFKDLIDHHRDRVYNVCYRILGHKHEAEDVAQEVFITVFKTIGSFRGDSKLSTWLYRIAVNHSKNRIKYLARRHDRDRGQLDDASDTAIGQVGATAPASPDRALEGVQLEASMTEAIRELDEEHRVVVVLRDLEDLSIEEICDITGLPDGTVKSRLHRARLALRKKLKHHAGDGA